LLSLNINSQIAPEVLIGIVALKIRMPRIHMLLIAVIEVIFTFCIFHKSPLSGGMPLFIKGHPVLQSPPRFFSFFGNAARDIDVGSCDN
jgi:uncharacterized membrane protein